MAKLEIQIHENTGATKDAAPYLGTFISKGSVDFTALAEQMSALSGLPAIQMEAILRGAFDEFVKLEKEGAVRINFDGGCVCLVVKGRFDSSDAAFDPEKNSLELVWNLSDAIRNSLANEVPKIVSDETSTKVRLDNVADLEAPRPYQVIHGAKPFKCTGINLVTDDAGAAVYLEDERGTQLPCTVDAVVSKQEFTAHVAATVEPGDYRLVVKSRGGDPEGVLQTTFRKVKCLAAEFTGPKIAYAYSSGHESEHDVIYDGASVTIKGNRLGDATGCAFVCKDKTGVEHKSDYGADFSISEDGTQIVISDTMTVSHMRENCTAAMSELDVDAGATVKLTLSDGTELTHHVSFGE